MNPTVRDLLIGIGSSALVAQFVPDLPLWIRVALAVITLICLGAVLFPRIWSAIQNIVRFLAAFVKIYWKFLTILAVTIALTLIVYNQIKPKFPREVLKARRDVVEINRFCSMTEANTWVVVNQEMRPVKRVCIRDHELIKEESLEPQSEVLATHIKHGRKLASDVRIHGLYPFARKYYRQDGCNFATEYFDKSGRYVFLEYDKDCTGRPEIFDLGSPVFSPPVPLLTYR